jgi:hypothetical protein
MKKLLFMSILASGIMISMQANAQQAEDKTKRPSPPALAKEKIKGGATISIDYSQPSVKGRSIGKDLEPMEGKVWRTGANEATVFETDKDLMVNGKKLPAGKYGLFTIFNGDNVIVIFSKTWKQWGAFKYNEADDQLRIEAKNVDQSTPAEKMTFKISPSGKVTLLWGNKKVDFMVN